eukprot:CAMPEP_0115852328 /NCGR_PEP_ID=MMETSP0287-20121206/12940_1 /TAXON_ID=412157 /ORGANISM="Chrysochromulina rotalis, Strain UIO044" /LENGTH=193 /DNA_ID=CAMNT_0003306387 /DNA_START=2177 /DNA_END=2755 /DNA_ORIENTATION=+
MERVLRRKAGAGGFESVVGAGACTIEDETGWRTKQWGHAWRGMRGCERPDSSCAAIGASAPGRWTVAAAPADEAEHTALAVDAAVDAASAAADDGAAGAAADAAADAVARAATDAAHTTVAAVAADAGGAAHTTLVANAAHTTDVVRIAAAAHAVRGVTSAEEEQELTAAALQRTWAACSTNGGHCCHTKDAR